MAVLNFQKPDKILMIKSDDFKGLFEFKPLESGYGMTVGNSLRRILLSSLEGFAITNVRIDGINNEFSTIEGVIEDVTQIILNLKQIRLKQVVEKTDKEEVKISVKGKEQLKGADINNFLNGFKVINPDLVICNMEKSVNLDINILIEKGRGYVFSDENEKEDMPLGTIAIDSVFTPIKNVVYNIEDFRVEQKTDFEKLVIEVETDGSITPMESIKEAASILISHLVLLSDSIVEPKFNKYNSVYDEEALAMRKLLKLKLADFDISIRALNCLSASDINTLGQLVACNKNDLMKFRNFGKKSLLELEYFLSKKNLSFGMDLSKYNLDN